MASGSLNCSNCGESLTVGDRFCGACGANVNACISCRGQLVVGDRFCANCGQAVDPSRITAVNSTAGAGDDFDGWGSIVRRLKTATAGEFEIVREVGRGGMAAVYLAHELALDRNVAMKVMSPALLTGAGMVERFQREARTVAKLVHPNIVTIHAVRQFDDVHFFTMQFVEGRSLDHIVRDAGPLPIAMVRGLLFTIGNALAYAHRRGVVHRDVKPANILIGEDGSAVVTDFGIAKVAQDSVSSNTQTNTVVGTPAYISPEQCYSHPATAASDQYSLGVVAFELLTGNTPYSGSAFAVMQAHTERPVPSIRAIRSDCPPELERAVLRMLEKEPGNRWPTMQHALAELGAMPLVEGDPVLLALAALAIPEQTARRSSIVAEPSAPSHSSDAANERREDPPPYVATVAILAPPDALEVGDTIVLSASARNAAGSTMPGARLSWTVDDPNVATVDPTRGAVHAVAPGQVTVTAVAEGVTRSVRLQVIPRRVAAVNISMPPGNLHVGDRVRLVAKAEDKTHSPLDDDIRWASGDAEIAAVSNDGVLTANAPGMALIWAEAQGVRGSARVDVNPAVIASIRLSNPPQVLELGDRYDLHAAPYDAHDNPVHDRVTTWETSDSDVATITRDGRIEACGIGSARLTGTCEGKRTSISIKVIAPPTANVVLSGAPRQATVGEPFVLSAQAFSRRGLPIDRRFDWSAAPRKVVKLSRDGTVTPIAPGDVTIRASTNDGAESVMVNVVAPAVAHSGVMEPVDSSRARMVGLGVGDSGGRRSAPANARRRLWIGGGSVAAIVLLAWVALARRGPAGPQQSGRDTVPAQLEGRPGAKPDSSSAATPVSTAQATLASAAPPPSPPASVVATISIVGVPKRVTVGDGFSVTADVRDANDAVLANHSVRWRSTVPGVATVDRATGRVTAHGEGQTILLAESDGKTQGSPLVVTRAPIVEERAAISIAPLSAPLRVFGSVRLAANTSGGAATPAPIRWVSDSPGVVQVDTAGRITGLAEGTANIFARWRDVSAVLRVTVGPAVVASVVVSPATVQLTEGDQVPLRAISRDGRNGVLSGREVAWRSENPEIASVDNAGLVVARRAGTTTIAATSEERSGRATITVATKPVTQPVASPRPATVAAASAPADRAAADRAIDAALAGFVSAINGHDDKVLKTMVTDAASWAQLSDSKQNLHATDAQKGASQVGDAQVTAAFKTTLNWTNNSRRPRKAVAECRAVFALQGGAWVLQGISILNTLE